MTDYSYTQNRELSWLNFNLRVMEEALDKTVPLFEKLKFFGIFCSNLDEFMMVRVGGLSDLALIDDSKCDNKSGLTPSEQLRTIYRALREIYKEKDEVYSIVEHEFRKEGIYNLKIEELSKAQRKAVHKYFKNYALPILTPLAIDVARPFPFLENLQEYVILELERKGVRSYGIMAIPKNLPKLIKLPTSTGHPYIRRANVIYEYVEDAYPDYKIISKNIIRITRNMDLSADDELDYGDVDYRKFMKDILKKRKRLQAVRVEVSGGKNENIVKFLCEHLHIREEQIFSSNSPLSMEYVSELKDYLGQDFISQNSYGNYLPRLGDKIGFSHDIIGDLKKKDYLLSYPYDSMDSFLKLIEQAAQDDRVVSIKITIYRLAKNSRLVDSLCRAAENGKEVLVLMELRARFDEESNLNYSKKLFDAGCNIIYGMAGFKVHSKIALITLKDNDGWSYITQIGTGNYNEQTSNGYADFCLMTSNDKIGKDAVKFFKNLTIGNLNVSYSHLLQSPKNLKISLLESMDKEILKGEDGFIFFKMNSLTDRDFIDKLKEASENGVKVQMIIRGICCILPGKLGKTDNIEAHSVVGRFLEHARVYVFGKEEPTVYMGSADLMTRNTEHRVELLCPVLDPVIKNRVIDYMNKQFDDNVKGRKFGEDGGLYKIINEAPPFNSQDYFMNEEYKIECDKEEKNSFLSGLSSFFKGFVK